MILTWPQFAAKMAGWGRRLTPDQHSELTDLATEVKQRTATQHLSGPQMPVGVGSQTHPTLDSKGAMRNMLRTRVGVNSGKILAEVISAHGLSRIHHEGGVIAAPRGRPMRFQVGGRWRTAKRVVMPARPFLGAALRALRETIVKRLGRRQIDSYQRSQP